MKAKIIVRDYDTKKDQKAVHRVWREVGWIEKGKEKVMDMFMKACDVTVAEVGGEAEFLTALSSGDIQYLDKKLPFSGVMAVTTGRITRKMGLAGKVTSEAIADSALKGSCVSGLGIFEQGFYDMLGYRTGNYEHFISFDPADLKNVGTFRIPKRISEKNWKKVHNSRMKRMRKHGSVNFFEKEITGAEMRWTTKGFGLGYENDKGEITHFFWGAPHGENGPYNIDCIAYRTYEQFLELLALIKSLGDQVRMVRIGEPPYIQMQDFLKQPFRFRQLTERSKYENKMTAVAWWQMRILDLKECMKQTSLSCEKIKFNLILDDPIKKHLDKTSKWQGIGGDYTITLGKKCKAAPGHEKGLPVMAAGVGAFTGMWLGFRPASTLAVSDNLHADAKLLDRLDAAFLLPDAKPDWAF